jgi:hypothetical protein
MRHLASARLPGSPRSRSSRTSPPLWHPPPSPGVKWRNSPLSPASLSSPISQLLTRPRVSLPGHNNLQTLFSGTVTSPDTVSRHKSDQRCRPATTPELQSLQSPRPGPLYSPASSPTGTSPPGGCRNRCSGKFDAALSTLLCARRLDIVALDVGRPGRRRRGRQLVTVPGSRQLVPVGVESRARFSELLEVEAWALEVQVLPVEHG